VCIVAIDEYIILTSFAHQFKFIHSQGDEGIHGKSKLGEEDVSSLWLGQQQRNWQQEER